MHTLSFNPICCLDCNLEVPPERISPPKDVVEMLAHWVGTYGAVERLWLDSADYELWARRELSNINSRINQLGRQAAARLNPLRRCYYWYFQDTSADGYVPISVCPACGQALAPYTTATLRQLICEACSIVTEGPDENGQ